MKAVFAIAVLCCVAAMAQASGYGYHRPGFRRVYNGIAAVYNNADRQVAVNRRAEYAGASSGTARYDGVPGTGRDFGYGYGYGNNGYGNDGYGYGGYGNEGYGNDGYGNRGGYGH